MEYDPELKKVKLAADIASLEAEAELIDECINTNLHTTVEASTNEKVETSPLFEVAPEINAKTVSDQPNTDKDGKSEGEKETLQPNNPESDDERTLTEPAETTEKNEKKIVKPKPPVNLSLVICWEGDLSNSDVEKAFSSIVKDESVKPTDAETNYEINLTDSFDMFLAEEEIADDNAW